MKWHDMTYILKDGRGPTAECMGSITSPLQWFRQDVVVALSDNMEIEKDLYDLEVEVAGLDN